MNSGNYEFYDWVFRTNPTRWDHVVEGVNAQPIDKVVKSFLEPYKDKKLKIIDLGCGNGRTLNFIKNDNWEMYACDYSPHALEEAKKILKDKVKYILSDMLNLPFEDKFFDIVISLGVYEHLDPITFDETHRVLKDKGIFIINVPTTDEDEGKTYFITRPDPNRIIKHFEWRLTKETWENMLKKQFEIKKHVEGTFLTVKKTKL